MINGQIYKAKYAELAPHLAQSIIEDHFYQVFRKMEIRAKKELLKLGMGKGFDIKVRPDVIIIFKSKQ